LAKLGFKKEVPGLITYSLVNFSIGLIFAFIGLEVLIEPFLFQKIIGQGRRS